MAERERKSGGVPYEIVRTHIVAIAQLTADAGVTKTAFSDSSDCSIFIANVNMNVSTIQALMSW